MDRNMLQSFMELQILCHRYRPLVVSLDQGGDLLLKQAELAV